MYKDSSLSLGKKYLICTKKIILNNTKKKENIIKIKKNKKLKLLHVN